MRWRGACRSNDHHYVTHQPVVSNSEWVTAEAVTGTVTIVSPVTGAFLTAYGCGAQPETSSVNADARLVLANALTVGVSAEGRLCLTASAVTHSLFDTTGWWVT